ncbi:glucose-6-phosphate isomerase [Brevibacterium casei]|uniref:glucose-6-phosphate isomerase n=1 Tax=Brevibacterium casei TaxID=33889 RepID=UPI00223ADC35|nr:glucose-6-phosphate isomerase [Brevibacterium casei]MCT2184253.1 glucose-6-phosphate isomerase [Brevibacterium casei]
MRVELSVPVSAEFDAEIARLLADRVPSRIADRDGTVFTDAAVAGDRLGWVDLPSRAEELLTEIEELRERLAGAGLRSISLTGMGGSSLAPEVMATAAGVDLEIVDSTDPNQVAEAIGTDLDHTVLVIASKSGTTIETDAIRRAFAAAFEAVGIDPASRFIAITDPGTELDALATEQGYLATFHGDPSVGGRFSALSPFGLVPAGLAGVDVRQIVASAAAISSDLTLDSEDNPALRFGTWLGIAHARATEKLVLADTSPALRGLGAWVEQLVAESLGKDGQGILPVVVDGPGDIGFADARADAVLCTLGSDADFGAPSGFNAVVDGDLGEQFLFWEFATAVAGYSIGVDPFDQPDVEAAKAFARAALDQGAQNDEYPVFADGDVEVYGDVDEATDLVGALRELFDSVDEYGYIGVQAYLDRLGDAGAADLRPLVSRHAGVQTTFGFGPRYLHSTGQYHKGGHPNGVFLQITADPRTELLVPGRGYGFAELQRAQALGDAAALRERGRPVLRLHLTDRARGLDQVRQAITAIEPHHHYGVD